MSVDMNDPAEATEVYTLLSENYVEDDDNMFRFDYSRDFLQWALKPPGYERDWHVGIRHTQTKKLYAFISGIPAHIRVYDDIRKMVEINFLCVCIRSCAVSDWHLCSSRRSHDESTCAIYGRLCILLVLCCP